MVDQQPQVSVWGGYTRLFTQLKGFGVFELDGKKAYPGIKEYTRTMFLVGSSNSNSIDSNAYVIDVFSIKGGHDHVFSFHGPPGEVTANGLKLQDQDKGTYAGVDVSKGTAARDFPVGYSFLYNVKKDAAPPSAFVIDWKAEDGYRGITGKDDIHLRMHAMTSCNDVALADA